VALEEATVNCPVDGAVLEMSERQGVEIDYCPNCRGVWLDRGELDKILERSESWSPTPEPRRERDDDRYDQRRDDRSSAPHKKKKRTSFLSELFED
jgi:Zn-finger nucleic acid-binding protein